MARPQRHEGDEEQPGEGDAEVPSRQLGVVAHGPAEGEDDGHGDAQAHAGEKQDGHFPAVFPGMAVEQAALERWSGEGALEPSEALALEHSLVLGGVDRSIGLAIFNPGLRAGEGGT